MMKKDTTEIYPQFGLCKYSSYINTNKKVINGK